MIRRLRRSPPALAAYATGFSNYLPEPPTPRMALRRTLAQVNKNIGGGFYARQLEYERSPYRRRVDITTSAHRLYGLLATGRDSCQPSRSEACAAGGGL